MNQVVKIGSLFDRFLLNIQVSMQSVRDRPFQMKLQFSSKAIFSQTEQVKTQSINK